jgi:putative ABC transport system permease protein
LWRAELLLPEEYDTNRKTDFLVRMVERLEAVPDVLSAATITVLPLGGSELQIAGLRPYDDPDRVPEQGVAISTRSVSVNYFLTAGIPILHGRGFTESDPVPAGTSPRIAILNESAARLLWGDTDIVGRLIGSRPDRTMTVVGVVPDFKHQQLDSDVVPQLYLPADQAFGFMTAGSLLIRARNSTAPIAEIARNIILDLEPVATLEAETMTQARWRAVEAERFRTGILLGFALTALLLAMIGIYGVVSYGVVQRRREIGIRMTLGAQRRAVLGLVLRQAMGPALAGLGVGLLSAIGVTRLLVSFLFEVSPTDPRSFAIAAVGLLAAALAACLLPARRASRIDPMTVLKQD